MATGVLVLAPSGWSQSDLFVIHGDAAGDTLGQSVDIVGDVNGDGFADVLAGAWRDDDTGTDAGSLRVVSGADGAVLLLLFGDLAGDHLGWGSSGAGDVDGDGRADIAAAADEADVAGISSAGSVKVVSGATGQVVYFLAGDGPADLFGWSTAPAGDVDADGFVDLAIGALLDDDPSKVNCGSVTVVSGQTGAILHRLVGAAPNDNLGHSVGGGDVNGDGFSDVVAGAPGADPNGSGSGSAYVFDGATGVVRFQVDGDSAGDALGRAVSAASDLDLDGHADLIVGAPTDDVGFTNNGSVRVLSGATGNVLYAFAGLAALDRFGDAVRGLGDVDGDGYGDVAVGAPGADTAGSGSGAVYFFSGRDGRRAYDLPGGAAGDAFGTSVGGGGDVNGDGYLDLVAGAVGADDGGAGSGNARVLSLVPQGVVRYAFGTPGCGGVERFTANGPPFPGNAEFTLIGSPGPPGGVGVLVVGDVADPVGNDVLQIGATLNIALAPIAGYVAGLPSFRDAKGALVAKVPLPPNPALTGATAVLQNITIWPQACPGLGPFKVSTSEAIRITIQ